MIPVPCPDCGCFSCHIFDDSFNTDRLGTDYETRAGSWTVVLTSLEPTSSPALIICNTAMPGDATTLRASAALFANNTSDRARLVFLYEDDDNFWFAEISNNGTNNLLKLFERSGGSNTQRESTQTLDGLIGNTVVVQVCVHSGTVHVLAYIAGEDFEEITHSASPTVAGTKCGFEAVESSVIVFENFTIHRHQTENAECPVCDADEPATASCGDGCAESPTAIAVVITGVTGTDNTNCNPPQSCPGIWERTDICFGGHHSIWNPNWPTTCRFISPGGSVNCAIFPRVELLDSGSDTVKAVVSVAVDGGFTTFHEVFSSDDVGIGSTPADCRNIVNASLTFISNGPLGCDWSGAIVEITSL